jgi:hypothetical protein
MVQSFVAGMSTYGPNLYEDQVVIKATPRPTDTSIKGLFKWGLEKWNIKVGEPKARGSGHAKAQRS